MICSQEEKIKEKVLQGIICIDHWFNTTASDVYEKL